MISSDVTYLVEKSGSKMGKKRKLMGESRSLQDLVDSPQSCTLMACLFNSDDEFNEFKLHHFRKNPTICASIDVSPLIDALNDLDVKALLQNTASDQIHVWLPKVGEASLDSITVEDAEQAHKLYKAGNSVYCRAPAELEALMVPKALREMNFGAVSATDRYRRGEIEMFFSRKGHITEFHTDFQENFTIQLQGRKEWTFVSSSATHPLRGCTPHFYDTKEKDVIEQQLKVLRLGDASFSPDQLGERAKEKVSKVVLQPGDVMYHPAGIWHKVTCLEDSISMNISLTGSSYAEVFCNSLQQLLLENAQWRAVVSSQEGEGKALLQSLLQALPSIISNIKPGDILPYSTTIHSTDEGHDGEVGEEGREEEVESVAAEEEESRKAEQTILVSNIDTSEWLSKLSNNSIVTKKNSSEFESLPFHINPLAMLLTSDDIDIDKKDQKSDTVSCIVHCGYGSESLESLSRVRVVLPRSLVWALTHILQQVTSFRQARINSYSAKIKWEGVVISLSDVMALQPRGKGHNINSADNVRRLLIALYQAGLFTLQHDNYC